MALGPNIFGASQPIYRGATSIGDSISSGEQSIASVKGSASSIKNSASSMKQSLKGMKDFKSNPVGSVNELLGSAKRVQGSINSVKESIAQVKDRTLKQFKDTLEKFGLLKKKKPKRKKKKNNPLHVDVEYKERPFGKGFSIETDVAKMIERNTGNGGTTSLKDFLEHITTFGLQVQNNFEISIVDLGKDESRFTFFIKSITLPTIKENHISLFFKHQSVEFPVNSDYEHSATMSILNDASGRLYNFFVLGLVNQSFLSSVGPLKLRVRCLNDNYTYGMTFILNNVRFVSCGQLQFDHSSNSISTFDVGMYVQSYELEDSENLYQTYLNETVYKDEYVPDIDIDN